MSYRVDVIIYPRSDLPDLGWIDNAAKDAAGAFFYAASLQQLSQSFTTRDRAKLEQRHLLTTIQPTTSSEYFPLDASLWPGIETMLRVFTTTKRLQIPFEGDFASIYFTSLPVPFDETMWPAIASLLNVFSTVKRSQIPFEGSPWFTVPSAYFPLDPSLWPAIETLLRAFRTLPRGGSVYNVDDTFIVDWIQGILLIGTFILFEDAAMASSGIIDATMAPGAYLDGVAIVVDIDSVREGMVSD